MPSPLSSRTSSPERPLIPQATTAAGRSPSSVEQPTEGPPPDLQAGAGARGAGFAFAPDSPAAARFRPSPRELAREPAAEPEHKGSRPASPTEAVPAQAAPTEPAPTEAAFACEPAGAEPTHAELREAIWTLEHLRDLAQAARDFATRDFFAQLLSSSTALLGGSLAAAAMRDSTPVRAGAGVAMSFVCCGTLSYLASRHAGQYCGFTLSGNANPDAPLTRLMRALGIAHGSVLPTLGSTGIAYLLMRTSRVEEWLRLVGAEQWTSFFRMLGQLMGRDTFNALTRNRWGSLSAAPGVAMPVNFEARRLMVQVVLLYGTMQIAGTMFGRPALTRWLQQTFPSSGGNTFADTAPGYVRDNVAGFFFNILFEALQGGFGQLARWVAARGNVNYTPPSQDRTSLARHAWDNGAMRIMMAGSQELFRNLARTCAEGSSAQQQFLFLCALSMTFTEARAFPVTEARKLLLAGGLISADASDQTVRESMAQLVTAVESFWTMLGDCFSVFAGGVEQRPVGAVFPAEHPATPARGDAVDFPPIVTIDELLEGEQSRLLPDIHSFIDSFSPSIMRSRRQQFDPASPMSPSRGPHWEDYADAYIGASTSGGSSSSGSSGSGASSSSSSPTLAVDIPPQQGSDDDDDESPMSPLLPSHRVLPPPDSPQPLRSPRSPSSSDEHSLPEVSVHIRPPKGRPL